MKEIVNDIKIDLRNDTIASVAAFIFFFECFWALLYAFKSFWSWGYFCEEIGLLAAAVIAGLALVCYLKAFYEMYKESTENSVE